MALLIVTIVLAVLYVYYALWPYEKAIKREVRCWQNNTTHTRGLLCACVLFRPLFLHAMLHVLS